MKASDAVVDCLREKAKWGSVTACASSQISVYDDVEHWAKREAVEMENGAGTVRTDACAAGFDLEAGS